MPEEKELSAAEEQEDKRLPCGCPDIGKRWSVYNTEIFAAFFGPNSPGLLIQQCMTCSKIITIGLIARDQPRIIVPGPNTKMKLQ